MILCERFIAVINQKGGILIPEKKSLVAKKGSGYSYLAIQENIQLPEQTGKVIFKLQWAA